MPSPLRSLARGDEEEPRPGNLTDQWSCPSEGFDVLRAHPHINAPNTRYKVLQYDMLQVYFNTSSFLGTEKFATGGGLQTTYNSVVPALNYSY